MPSRLKRTTRRINRGRDLGYTAVNENPPSWAFQGCGLPEGISLGPMYVTAAHAARYAGSTANTQPHYRCRNIGPRHRRVRGAYGFATNDR